MNQGLTLLGQFVRDLLAQPESDVVQIGRENFRRDDFLALQIVIDSIGASTMVGSSEDYDSTNEVMKYSQVWKMPCIVNFYGTSSFQEAVKFSALVQSQAGYELQRDAGLSVFEVGALNDLRFLSGEQYSERYELELNIRFTIAEDVSTLRIDEAQVDDILVD
jgi:hypothetical protein